MQPVKTAVTHIGQKYVDDPVYVFPTYAQSSPIASAVAEIYGTQKQLPQPIVVRHDRTKLRWMKPDGRGGLVPR